MVSVVKCGPTIRIHLYSYAILGQFSWTTLDNTYHVILVALKENREEYFRKIWRRE
jgi:hypothetical protein